MSRFARSTPGAVFLTLLIGALAAFATLLLLVSLAHAQESPDAGTFQAAGVAVADRGVAIDLGGAAQAEASPDPVEDDYGAVENALRGVRRSDLKWQVKVGLLLVVLVSLLRRYATRIPAFSIRGKTIAIGAFFASSTGGTVLLFLTVAGGALGSAMAADGSFDWRLVESSVKLGFVTIGGWHALVKPAKEYLLPAKPAPVVT